MFATAVYGVVDTEAKEIRLASAGHPTPLVRRKEKVELLEFSKGSKGPALGLMSAAVYGETVLSFDEMDGIWCFTDGIYEIENADGEDFGTERMASHLAKGGTSESLVEEARSFAIDQRFDDDVCVLGLELR